MGQLAAGALSWKLLDPELESPEIADQKADDDGETLSWVFPGGCSTAALKVTLTRDQCSPALGSQTPIEVSAPDGTPLFSGYCSDPGAFDTDDGEGMSIAAVGTSVVLSDSTEVLIYLDADGGQWSASKASHAAASVNTGSGDDPATLGFQAGYARGPGDVAALDYAGLARSTQTVGAVALRPSMPDPGVLSGYAVEVVGLDAAGVVLSTQSVAVATTPTAGPGSAAQVVKSMPAGVRTARVQVRRTGDATNAVGSDLQVTVADLTLVGSRVDRHGNTVANPGTTLSSAGVVEDLIGRGLIRNIDVDAALVEDSTAVLKQLAWTEGVHPSAVLDALVEQDTTMGYEVLTRLSSGALEFAWRHWPTTARYEFGDHENIDRPGGEDEACQRVMVLYNDLDGVPQRLDVEVPDLADGVRVRDADPLTLSDPTSPADALTAGQKQLADLASPTASGTVTVTRNIYDLLTEQWVAPYMMRPGYLGRIGHTGELVQITEVEWTEASGASCTIGKPAPSTDEQVAALIRGDLIPQPLIPAPVPRPSTPPPVAQPTNEPDTAPGDVVVSVTPFPDCVIATVIQADGSPVDPTTTLEYHLGSAPDFTPSPSTLARTDRSPIVSLDTDPTGSPLVLGVPWWLRVVAINVAGDSDPSPSVAAALSPVTGPDIADGAITAKQLAAIVVLAGAIRAGLVTIDANGISVTNPTTGMVTRIAPGDSVFDGAVRASSAVIQYLRIVGTFNYVEGALELSQGVTAPTVAPRANPVWPSVSGLVGFDARFVNRGLFSDGSNWAFTVSVYGGNISFVGKNDGGYAGRIDLPLKFCPTGGVVRVGALYYVLGFDINRGGDWYVYSYNSSGVKQSEWKREAVGIADTYALATDGTYLYTVSVFKPGGFLSVDRFNPDGTSPAYQLVRASPPADEITGLVVSSADFGALRYTVATKSGLLVYPGGTGVSPTAQSWTRAAGDDVLGLAWDGTRFHSLSGQGNVYDYSTVKTDTSRAVTVTKYDGDPAGVGTQETTASPVLNWTQPARAWMQIEGDAPGDGGDPDDPDRLRFYVDNHRQVDVAPGVLTITVDAPSTSGSAAPTSNGFAATSHAPGNVHSGAGDTNGSLIYLDGAGDYRLGGRNLDSIPWTTPTLLNSWANYGASGSEDYADASYRRDGAALGGIVQLRGLVKDGTVSNTGVVFTLPAGCRPTKQLVFAVYTFSGVGRLDVKPDGSVLAYLGDNRYFSLSGVTFAAEQ